jgi:hypothetical protein
MVAGVGGRPRSSEHRIRRGGANTGFRFSLAGTTRTSFTHSLGTLRKLNLVQGTRGMYRIRLEALEEFLETSAWNGEGL